MGKIMGLISKAFGWPGFGYNPPEIKFKDEESDGGVVEISEKLHRKTNEVERQVELLEWELRRAGLDKR